MNAQDRYDELALTLRQEGFHLASDAAYLGDLRWAMQEIVAELIRRREQPPVKHLHLARCPICMGTGRVTTHVLCSRCLGKGQVLR